MEPAEEEEGVVVCFPGRSEGALQALLDVVYARNRDSVSDETRNLLEALGFRYVSGGRLEEKVLSLEPEVELTEGKAAKRERNNGGDGDDSFDFKRMRTSTDDFDGDYPREEEQEEYYGEEGEDGVEEEEEEEEEEDEKFRRIPRAVRTSQQSSVSGQVIVQRNNIPVPRHTDKLRTDRNNMFLCPVINCEYALTNREAMSTHVTNMHTKVECATCGERVRPKDMPVHRSRYHPDRAGKPGQEAAAAAATTSDGGGNYPCAEAGCPHLSEFEAAARAHANAHTKTICEFCGKSVNRAQLKTHISRRHTSGYVGR